MRDQLIQGLYSVRIRRPLAGAVRLALASLFFVASAVASQIKVMTRNIYLGAYIAQLALAPNRAPFITEK